MDKQTAIKVLTAWDEGGRYVFTRHDLAKLFPDDSAKTLQEAVNRLVKDGWLRRACRGVYVYALARSIDSHTVVGQRVRGLLFTFGEGGRETGDGRREDGEGRREKGDRRTGIGRVRT